jgi:TatD DNase family protein
MESLHLIDTHTHLYLPEFDRDRDDLIKRAVSMGVKEFYLPNINSSSIQAMFDLEKNNSACFAMMGLHPCSVGANVEEELAVVKSWLDKRKFKGVGEIGLDLYWDKTFFEQQKHAFRTQLQWAVDFHYAVSIHCREAFDPLYEILQSMSRLPKAVFHCFSGTAEQAKKIIDLGNFKLGIGGVVTFKNAGLDKVISEIDLEHLVLETDAPYLAPVPFRGKRNEPAYLLEVVKKIAGIKNCTISEVAKPTSTSAEYIFQTP